MGFHCHFGTMKNPKPTEPKTIQDHENLNVTPETTYREMVLP